MKQTVVFLLSVLSFLSYLEAGLPYHHNSNQNHRGFLTKRKAKVIPNAPDGLDASKYNPDLTSDCNVPSISKTITVSTPTTVAAGETFDCQFAKYQHTDTSCNLDNEKGDQDAVFILEEGATLKNCILGFSQESVHCKGGCTVENSHWVEICDDAINFQMTSGEATVSGCSFANAGNKALQFNGGGTLNVNNACFSNVDIAYRSCGNCKTTTKRAVVFDNVDIKGVKVLAGYNHADGDTVDINSYSGTAATTMCEAKDAGTSEGEVPPGCTISGAGSSSNSTTSPTVGSSNSTSETNLTSPTTEGTNSTSSESSSSSGNSNSTDYESSTSSKKKYTSSKKKSSSSKKKSGSSKKKSGSSKDKKKQSS